MESNEVSFNSILIINQLINFFCSGMLSHDSKLRCDYVDIFYSLYGTRAPLCLPNAELSAMFKPQKINFGNEPKSRPPSRPATPLSSLQSSVIHESNYESNSLHGISPIASGTGIKRSADDEFEIDDIEIKMEDDDKIVKEEIIDIIPQMPIVIEQDNLTPPVKKPKSEYYSDNSVSLPGLSSAGIPSSSGPITFEPGMFIKEEDEIKPTKSEVPGIKPKKKKKDKKKHRHKHKHKKNREKDKDKSTMEKKDPNISRILKEEAQETLSSADSSSNSNPQMDLSLTL